VHFDESRWPLVIATAPRLFVPETVTALEQTLDGYFRRGSRYALIVDPRPVAKLPDAKCRSLLFKWLNTPAVRANVARYSAGSAVIVASQVARYGMTVISWVFTSPSPMVIVRDMGHAVEQACRLLEQASVPLGVRLSEFREASRQVA
jgi:hypothetical protein